MKAQEDAIEGEIKAEIVSAELEKSDEIIPALKDDYPISQVILH